MNPLPTAPAASAGSLRAELAIHALDLFQQGDPDEVLRRAGLTRASLRALEGDDEIAQATETRLDAYLTTPWRIEPGNTRAGRFLTDEIAPWVGNLLSGAWAAVPYGYSVLEAVYDDRPLGRVGLAQLTEKPFEWFFVRGGRWWLRLGDGRELPADPLKFLVTVRGGTYRQPYGRALFSALYWPVFFRSGGWRLWMRYLDRFSMPVVAGRVADPQAFVTAMREAGIDLAIGVGAEEGVDVLFNQNGGEFERLEKNCVERIQRLVLGQTGTSGVEQAGSYAAVQVLDGVRDDKRRADLRLGIAAGQALVNALCALNGFSPHRFLMEDESGLQAARAERDAKLASAGVVRFLAPYLEAKYGLLPGEYAVPEAGPADPLAEADSYEDLLGEDAP